MLRYELLILTVPELTADESNTIESQLDTIVTENKGSVISYERWGKYQLAYSIRKYDYGVYFLMRFEVNKENMHELIRALYNYFEVRQTELVMRYIVIKLDPKASLEYKRPDSLEDTPTRDVDTFLKENKMTGLLSSSATTTATVQTSEVKTEEVSNKFEA